ncbi:Uma2 family endonuclease [Dactylosporangium aurantiacum]|uniref:Uma2 family endonuclease n=1 Tax=Dactylosporangium aurantiacum TaxID=35754 RepID=A0A9Q9IFQ1_9ACTN|nr:Uma2 family endonuclease [Dactylosporangium aurantiacum]MDG6110168.1 Uma2 family endonuclease [Dactylosporangium aurantiacum]UWZ54636.1 Uma2 family endonuclease [Dactylosporangium aurantiacum]
MTMQAVTAQLAQGWAIDGSLVTPHTPAISHRRASHRLETVLRKACPPQFTVLAVGLGVDCGDGRTYVPDLIVTGADALDDDGDAVPATDVLAVVEVMSLSNPLPGLVLRRHDYAAAGIPQFWIFDSRSHTLTVHTDPAAGSHADGYLTTTTVPAGDTFTTALPFPVTFSPGLIR